MSLDFQGFFLWGRGLPLSIQMGRISEVSVVFFRIHPVDVTGTVFRAKSLLLRSLSLSLYTFTANTRRKPRVLQNTQGFHWKPGVLLFSSFFAFEHVHTDASMSCLSIEATGVSSEDLRFFVPKSCSASDLKPVIFFTGLHG